MAWQSSDNWKQDNDAGNGRNTRGNGGLLTAHVCHPSAYGNRVCPPSPSLHNHRRLVSSRGSATPSRTAGWSSPHASHPRRPEVRERAARVCWCAAHVAHVVHDNTRLRVGCAHSDRLCHYHRRQVQKTQHHPLTHPPARPYLVCVRRQCWRGARDDAAVQECF